MPTNLIRIHTSNLEAAGLLAQAKIAAVKVEGPWYHFDRGGSAYQRIAARMPAATRTPREPLTVGKVATAAASIVKTQALRMDRVSDEEHARRLAICKACPRVALNAAGEPGKCEICGCGLSLKARDKSQQCPEGKW